MKYNYKHNCGYYYYKTFYDMVKYVRNEIIQTLENNHDFKDNKEMGAINSLLDYIKTLNAYLDGETEAQEATQVLTEWGYSRNDPNGDNLKFKFLTLDFENDFTYSRSTTECYFKVING